MENASKALIIAGAILISIVLISVGIAVVNSSSGITDDASKQMDKQAQQMFNAQFESYQGNAVSGSQVKSLISQIIASNNQYVDTFNRQISIDISTASDLKGNTKIDQTKLKPSWSTADAGQLETDTQDFAKNANILRNAVNVGNKYNVTAEIEPKTGLINLINIADKN